MKVSISQNPDSQIILYQAPDGQTKIEVKLQDETVWLTQEQMAELFQKGRSTITEHIVNVFEERELDEKSVCREFRRTGTDGKEYLVKHYNLDIIISVGYRVKSLRGTQFRIWATKQLREYIVKGFVMDDQRLENGKTIKGINYFNELLERVRSIRASEMNFYEKVRDTFATSIDYDSKAETAKEFYSTVQNKFHCLMNDEIIYPHTPEITNFSKFDKLPEEKLTEIDNLAKLLQDPDKNFDQLQKLWETKKEFRLLTGGLL